MNHLLPAALISVVLIGLAFRDVTNRPVHPFWMSLLLTALVAWRLSRHDLSFLPFWLGVIVFWGLRFYQLWDAQVLMALFALWPDPWLVIGICLVVLVIVGSILYWRYRGQFHVLWYWWRGRIRTRAWLLSPTELTNGEPIAYLFTTAGIAYAWLVGGFPA